MTAQEMLRSITRRFADKGIEDPAREAEALFIGLLDFTKVQLYSDTINLSEEGRQRLAAGADRRIAGEPLQYIIGRVEFLGLAIMVGGGVLIPRPETELLVEAVITILRSKPSCNLRILDLCTGSGCISLALAKSLPGSIVIGVDHSVDALTYAARNAEINGITNALFIEGDLFNPVPAERDFDVIVSNPPYIRTADISTLQREVRDHEPLEALDGGVDGLDYYRRILGDAQLYLKGGGLIALEIGHDQSEDIRRLSEDAGYAPIRFLEDYAGIRRIAIVTAPTA